MHDVARWCESRQGRDGRVASVIVMVDGRFTVAATASWELCAAFGRAVLCQK